MDLFLNNWTLRATTNNVVLSIVALILTGLLMRPSSSCLVMTETPRGIVDLELAFRQSDADSIVSLWTENTCDNRLALASRGDTAAIVNIFLDFPFLLAYTNFFMMLVRVTALGQKSLSQFTKILMWSCLTAGLLDAIENFFMLAFIFTGTTATFLFALPASVKFGLLAVLTIIILVRIPFRLMQKH